MALEELVGRPKVLGQRVLGSKVPELEHCFYELFKNIVLIL